MDDPTKVGDCREKDPYDERQEIDPKNKWEVDD